MAGHQTMLTYGDGSCWAISSYLGHALSYAPSFLIDFYNIHKALNWNNIQSPHSNSNHTTWENNKQGCCEYIGCQLRNTQRVKVAVPSSQSITVAQLFLHGAWIKFDCLNAYTRCSYFQNHIHPISLCLIQGHDNIQQTRNNGNNNHYLIWWMPTWIQCCRKKTEMVVRIVKRSPPKYESSVYNTSYLCSVNFCAQISTAYYSKPFRATIPFHHHLVFSGRKNLQMGWQYVTLRKREPSEESRDSLRSFQHILLSAFPRIGWWENRNMNMQRQLTHKDKRAHFVGSTVRIRKSTLERDA